MAFDEAGEEPLAEQQQPRHGEDDMSVRHGLKHLPL
jgi:hypothetical protein